MKRRLILGVVLSSLVAGLGLIAARGVLAAEENAAWPPSLKGADANGTATIKSDLFLKVPDSVQAGVKKEGAAPFVVAKTAPEVDLAYHRELPGPGFWTSWGDIVVADDGKVYCGIGDHGEDAAGKAHALLYEYDPAKRTLKKVVDINALVPRKAGEPAWSKMHARVTQGADGAIYFSATLNDGNLATQPAYKWSKDLPGGQLYQYDPKTGKAGVFANLPPKRATATAIMDRQRNIWWCNLEAGGNALFALDLATKKVVFQGPDGSVGLNRNFALANDGAVYFNGKDGEIWKYDPKTHAIAKTGSTFPPKAEGMRASTAESKDGWIYGCTMTPGRLFRYAPAKDKLEMLGPDFLHGEYTVVCALSPDERFVYYLPGAHGSAFQFGTPVIQYEIATGQRKVIAFLREAMEKACEYVPAGTYGVKLSPDGGTLYVNFNGHPAPATGKKTQQEGFGLTALAAIHIPKSER